MRGLVCCAALVLTAASLAACSGGDKDAGDGISGSWDVRAEDTRELWIWLDSDFPEDEEFFTVTASPTAVPEDPFEGGAEVALSFTRELENSADTGDSAAAPATYDIVAELLLDDVVVATATADGEDQAVLLDTEGPLACVAGEACTLNYTVRASMNGEGVIVTADALISAWFTGSGTPPADAKVSITDF